MRGYFEIGIFHTKTESNIGTLWRSAYQMGASGIYTIGRRYQTQSSDTSKAWKRIPLRHHEQFDEFYKQLPREAA
jgi:tRNA (guanosine-2'-O-)-methyltransferase